MESGEGVKARVLLGFPPNYRPSRGEVKAAYRRKVWDCHPDLFPPNQKPLAESNFKSISQAYTLLLSPASATATGSGRLILTLTLTLTLTYIYIHYINLENQNTNWDNNKKLHSVEAENIPPQQQMSELSKLEFQGHKGEAEVMLWFESPSCFLLWEQLPLEDLMHPGD
ncbi:DnaJ domain containing protein [Trema orientale]|uniref:DnaJ domain containing protein n=1 Tax=Trema orientale TaxID=63057 RepID=A0A2P5ET88_TREOI|nr:DnaJ domain containing protein [Trema orientale]